MFHFIVHYLILFNPFKVTGAARRCRCTLHLRTWILLLHALCIKMPFTDDKNWKISG